MTPETLMPEAADEVNFECELEAPPEKVWRALSVPEFLATWLMPNTLRKTRMGERFAFDGQKQGLAKTIECEVLAAEPERLLRYRWAEPGSAASVVTFELSPYGEGTWLRVVHTAPSRFAAAIIMSAANCNGPPLRLAA